MTLADIKARLEGVLGKGKVAYRQFPEDKAPALPWAVYYSPNTNNFNADGRTYVIISNITIELYTQNKDIALEARVEETINDISWEKTEEYIESERMYEIVYSLEI